MDKIINLHRRMHQSTNAYPTILSLLYDAEHLGIFDKYWECGRCFIENIDISHTVVLEFEIKWKRRS